MRSNVITTAQRSVRFHVSEAGHGQWFLVASAPEPVDTSAAAAATYQQIAQLLAEQGAQVVQERIFGSLSVEREVREARRQALTHHDLPSFTPLTYLQGHPPWGEGFAGVIIRAVRPSAPNEKVWTIVNGSVPCGRGWQRNGASFLTLQNLHGVVYDPDAMNLPFFQARRMIDRAQRILKKHGSSLKQVVRTWCYLAHILEWYEEFNEARNLKYYQCGILTNPDTGPPLLPASTGVEADNIHDAAAVLDLLAVTGPEESRPSIQHLNNHLQQDAFRYGSAFSRGTVIRESDVTLIQLSGTAAVGEGGESLCPGDFGGQVESTFNNIETLLSLQDSRLEDLCAATAFVKRPEDAELFWKLAAERGLADFPAICVVGDICRDELLFEIDGEAAVEPEARLPEQSGEN